MIKVMVNGALGKMGSLACEAIEADEALTLIKATRKDDLVKAIHAFSPEVVLDLTEPQSVYENAKTIVDQNVRPIIGTSGLTKKAVDSLTQHCKEKRLGGMIVPNFSLGAALMMRFSKMAAHYFDHAEIIEGHHFQKKDAPSGTSIQTAEMMTSVRKNAVYSGKEHHPGATGANINNVPVHAIRLPGMLAHQQVLFGGDGERLTITHDSTDRQCFMRGILLCCHHVMTIHHLLYGLDTIL
jgi:4-hydroxy-tetrahydrodipicolinate reductase